MPSKKRKYNARFPAGRIKKIMQTDEEVGKVAQAVPIIISRTLELFVESLLSKAMQVTMQRNAKTLSPSHVKQCILAESRFDFLRDLVKNIPDAAAEEREMLSGESSPNSSRFSDISVPRRIAREDSNSSSSSDVKIQQIITAPKENFRRALSVETDIKPKNETITETAIDLTKKEGKTIITANFYQETLLTDEVQHNSVIKVNPTYASPQPSTSSYVNLTNLKPVETPEVIVPKAEHNPAFYIDIREHTPPRPPRAPILNIDFSKNLAKPEIKVLDTKVASIVGVSKNKKSQRQNSKSKVDIKKNNEAKVVAVVPLLDIDHLNSEIGRAHV